MERIKTTERSNKLERFEELEFKWHENYWDESAYWKFTAAEIDEIEKATNAIYEMACAAIDHVIKNRQLMFFGYNEQAIALIEKSWEESDNDFSLYTRLDLAYNGKGPPKLLEINGDTPTSLYEAAVVQWDWLEQVQPSLDQFNTIHDKLAERLQGISLKLRTSVHDDGLPHPRLHTTCVSPHEEDEGTTWYINYLAKEQGIMTKHVPIDQIGWRRYEAGKNDHFVDQNDLPIQLLFKLYPWEWLLKDQFGAHLYDEVMADRLTLLEPAWKMLLSNKRLLVTMWELFPYNPYLLETSCSPLKGKYAKKPFLGREGQSVSIVDGGKAIEKQPGTYDTDDFVYQEFTELAHSDGKYMIIGSWLIWGEAAGIGIRESSNLITNNMGRFVPHVFE